MYSTVKETIGENSEEKKRQENERKRTEDTPVFPPAQVALPQALVAFFVAISFTPVNTQDERWKISRSRRTRTRENKESIVVLAMR